MAEQFLIERVVVNGTEIKGWVNSVIDPGIVKTLNAGGSELDPSALTTTSVAPVFRGTTLDIKTLLDLAWTTQTIPHVAITTNAVDVWLQATAEGGTRGGAGKNTKCTLNRGCLRIVSISQGGEGLCQATVEIYADYDGTNVPVIFLADQNLPAGGAGSPNLWTIRAIKNGSAGSVLSELANIVIDLGVTIQRFMPANAFYPTETVIDGFAPTVRWQTADLATALTASAFSGAVAAAGGLIVYIGQFSTTAPGVNSTGALTLTFRAGSPWYTPGVPLGGVSPVLLDYLCQGEGEADLDLTKPPLAYGTGVTLPTETFVATYGPGPVKESTTEIHHTGGRVDFGLQWQLHGGQGVPWPHYSTLVRREPVITLDSKDVDYIAGKGIAGADIDTSFTCYLRKNNAEGEPIAAGSVHISISCSAGRIEPGDVGGAHNEILTPGIIVTPTGGLSISTTAAIS